MQTKENVIFIIIFFLLSIVSLVLVQVIMSNLGYEQDMIKDVISSVTIVILILYLVIRTLLFRRMLGRLKDSR